MEQDKIRPTPVLKIVHAAVDTLELFEALTFSTILTFQKLREQKTSNVLPQHRAL